MVLIEATHWPLVVVGAIPDAAAGRDSDRSFAETALWHGRDLRLAVIVRGEHTQAWAAQEEIFTWLCQHRDRLWNCVTRVAWIYEDELMRRNAERWLTLVGDRLFRGEITTFRSVRTAVSWLVSETQEHVFEPWPVAAPHSSQAAGL